MRLALVLLLLSACKPRVEVTDAGLVMPVGAVVNLSDMPPIPPPEPSLQVVCFDRDCVISGRPSEPMEMHAFCDGKGFCSIETVTATDGGSYWIRRER